MHLILMSLLCLQCGSIYVIAAIVDQGFLAASAKENPINSGPLLKISYY